MIPEHHLQKITEIVQTYVSSNIFIPPGKKLEIRFNFKDCPPAPVAVVEEFEGYDSNVLSSDAVQSFIAFHQKKHRGMRWKRLEHEIRQNFKTVRDVVVYGNDIEIEGYFENPANERWKNIKGIGPTFRDGIDEWLASLNLYRCMKL